MSIKLIHGRMVVDETLDFIKLLNVPNAYIAADAGKILQVNGGFNGLEFTDSPTLATLTLTENLELEETRADSAGVILKGGNRFLHDFQHPVGGGGLPVGDNLFLGKDAGNFHMGSTATASYQSSRNLGIGASSLKENTKGNSNVGIGVNSLTANTEGNQNFGMGYSAAQRNTVGNFNIGIGSLALQYNIDGDSNVAIGGSAGRGAEGNSHSNNVFIGYQSGRSITTGSSNIFFGFDSGYRQTTNSNLLIIDNQIRADVATELSNAILYGVMAALPADQTLRINAGITSIVGDIILPKTAGVGIKVDIAAPTFGFADLLGDQFSKNTGGTKPTLTAYNGAVQAWQFSDGDEAFLTYHLPHDYVPGTDIHLHVHWSQNNAGATGGTVDFRYSAIYAKGHNQAVGSVFTSTPITDLFSSIDINDGNSGLDRWQQHFTEITISAAVATAALFDKDDFEPDGVIELTLEMDSNNMTGTPSDPFIHYVDIHYQTTNITGTKSRTPDFYV